MVYLDDGHDCFKTAIPAESEEAARKYVEGNGEIVAIKEVTELYKIDAGYVADALKKDNFNNYAIDFIVRALQRTGICET